MKITIKIREAKTSDVEHLLKSIRPLDVYEAESATGKPIKDVLLEHVNTLDDCMVGLIDGEVCAMFGCAQVTNGSGMPWFLASEEAFKNPFLFMSMAKVHVDTWRNDYSYLYNYVHANNKRAIKMLDHLGFKLDEKKPYGVKEDLFHRFYMHVHS